MLEPYRRHTKKCPHFGKSQNYTKCNCPIYIYKGGNDRQSLKTRDWQRAIKMIDRWESAPKSVVHIISIRKAVDSYIKDCRTRNLGEGTITSYENTLDPLAKHCKAAHITNIAEITTVTVREFRDGRKRAASTQRRELQCLRTFFYFCLSNKWIDENPAKPVKPPREEDPPTMPFEREEIITMLDACQRITNFYSDGIARARLRARALLLLLLYSGFRISDAVKLERKRIDKMGRIFIRTMKTGVKLYITLPEDCLEALADVPVESEYFFWSGKCKLSTAVGSARRTIACVTKLAGIDGHPHRFRDTFAVELLLKGAELRTVQLLLGHKSIKTTEKHYAPYVRSYQKLLDEATGKLKFT